MQANLKEPEMVVARAQHLCEQCQHRIVEGATAVTITDWIGNMPKRRYYHYGCYLKGVGKKQNVITTRFATTPRGVWCVAGHYAPKSKVMQKEPLLGSGQKFWICKEHWGKLAKKLTMNPTANPDPIEAVLAPFAESEDEDGFVALEPLEAERGKMKNPKQSKLLRPGYAGHLTREELKYIQGMLEKSPTLRQKWGISKVSERSIRAAATNPTGGELVSVLLYSAFMLAAIWYLAKKARPEGINQPLVPEIWLQ